MWPVTWGPAPLPLEPWYLIKCYIKSLKEGAVAYVNREIHHAVSTWPVDAVQ